MVEPELRWHNLHMSRLAVLKQLAVEMASSKDAHRVPEPSLIMDNPAQVAAFREAGLQDGVMAPVYLFHCAQVCELVRPHETVLDLGCGPANQLAMIARLNPDTNFIGIDLSDEMLARGEETIHAQGLRNIYLRKGDITRLEGFADGSVAAVYSTMVLHHLENAAQLAATFGEANRVLRPGGGVYLVDFGHLKTQTVIRYFANQYADRQPHLFTTDYLNSLHAAFELADWKAAYDRHLRGRARLYSTFLVPYMIALKSRARRALPPALSGALSELRCRLPPHHQVDFTNLRNFFRLGGLRLPNFN